MKKRMYIQLGGSNFEPTEIQSGYQLTKTYGVWKDESVISHPWRLTHLPTGQGVAQCGSLKLAAICADEFEHRVDLSNVATKEDLTPDLKAQGKSIRDDLISRGLCIKFVDLYR